MRLKKDFVVREICGLKVLSGEGADNVNFSKLVKLNDSAAYLLESVGEKDFTEDELADLLCAKYEVERATALADAASLCTTLKDNGIVEE